MLVLLSEGCAVLFHPVCICMLQQKRTWLKDCSLFAAIVMAASVIAHTGCSSSLKLFFWANSREHMLACVPFAGHCHVVWLWSSSVLVNARWSLHHIALAQHAIICDFCSPPSLLVCTRYMRIVCIHGAIISGSATTQ